MKAKLQLKTKTILYAVRVPKYLAGIVEEFVNRNDIEIAPLLRYAISMTIPNLEKWSEGDKSKVQYLLESREYDLAVNQAKADRSAMESGDAEKVYMEMKADLKVGTTIAGPAKKGKRK